MNKFVRIEWNFSPPNYFGEMAHISEYGCSMSIRSGKIEAKIDPELYDANPNIRSKLQNKVCSRFFVAQMFNYRSYELSRPKISYIHSDGHKAISVELRRQEIKTYQSNLGTKITDKKNKITSDSMQEKTKEENKLTELVSNHFGDKLLINLFRSIGAAIHDPNNELVHLYKIRDVLSKKFNGKKNTIKILNLDENEWDHLGKLCSRAPFLRQGRHRDKAVEELRDASKSELEKARRIALTMIKKYAHHLKGQST